MYILKKILCHYKCAKNIVYSVMAIHLIVKNDDKTRKIKKCHHYSKVSWQLPSLFNTWIGNHCRKPSPCHVSQQTDGLCVCDSICHLLKDWDITSTHLLRPPHHFWSNHPSAGHPLGSLEPWASIPTPSFKSSISSRRQNWGSKQKPLK